MVIFFTKNGIRASFPKSRNPAGHPATGRGRGEKQKEKFFYLNRP
jgi:hypothetical protein